MPTALKLGLLLTLPITILGCASWNYDRIQLREPLPDLDSQFPRDEARKTSLGVAHLRNPNSPQAAAVVILVTLEKRVAAKFHAAQHQRDWGFSVERGYELAGQIDLELLAAKNPGPLAALRTIARQLAAYQGDPAAEHAHQLVAAGLVRIIQRWPDIENLGPTSDQVNALATLAPGGGRAALTMDLDGTFHISYRQGIAP